MSTNQTVSEESGVIGTKSIYGITFNQRQQFCREDVTLDGEPAQVRGTRMRLATVCQTKSGGKHFMWSWQAVQNVIQNKGGKFISYE